MSKTKRILIVALVAALLLGCILFSTISIIRGRKNSNDTPNDTSQVTQPVENTPEEVTNNTPEPDKSDDTETSTDPAIINLEPTPQPTVSEEDSIFGKVQTEDYDATYEVTPEIREYLRYENTENVGVTNYTNQPDLPELFYNLFPPAGFAQLSDFYNGNLGEYAPNLNAERHTDFYMILADNKQLDAEGPMYIALDRYGWSWDNEVYKTFYHAPMMIELDEDIADRVRMALKNYSADSKIAIECDPESGVVESDYFADATIYRINEYASTTFPNSNNNITNTYFTNNQNEEFWAGINLTAASKPTR